MVLVARSGLAADRRITTQEQLAGAAYMYSHHRTAGAAVLFFYFFFAFSVFNEGPPRVFCILSPWKVLWFAFKTLVGALDSLPPFSPTPRTPPLWCPLPNTKRSAVVVHKMLLTTDTTTHIAAKRQPPRRLACFAPRRRGRKPRKQRRRGVTTMTPQCKYNTIKR